MAHGKSKKAYNEQFYKERLRKQTHLTNDNAISESEIRDTLESMSFKQMAVFSTLLFNLYEEKHKHIWFAKGEREQHIQDLYDMIQAMKNSPFIVPLEDVFTGEGIDDRTKAYR